VLNATEAELARLGGDLTYYRDLQRMSTDDLIMNLLPDSPARKGELVVRRVGGVMCRSWMPTPVRRRLLVRSRVMQLTSPEAARGDVILSHIWYTFQRQDRQTPVIWSSQGIAPSSYYEYVNRGHFDFEDVVHLYNVFGRDAAALLIWTHAGAKALVDACPSLAPKVVVIPAPIVGAEDGVGEKPSIRDGVIRFLFVGGDAERKGLRAALNAFASVRGATGAARLTVVSRPPATLMEELHATPEVRFIPSGSSVNVIELMTDSDVLVLPTKADTYALTAVEAMARGCAILISDLEPLSEVAPDGRVGFVVPVGDVASLTGCMRTLVSQPSVLRAMQSGARKVYLERHSPTAFRTALGKLTADLISKEAVREL
jgi:glycosyltransferase involved in cell wall biosynthesis